MILCFAVCIVLKFARFCCCYRAESIKYIVDDAKSSKMCVGEIRQQLKQANRELKDLQDQREGILNAMNEAIEEADNLKDVNRELLNTNASLVQEKNQALGM